MVLTDLIVLIPLFPLLGVLANLAFGWRKSERLVGWIACGAIGLSFVVAAILFVGILGRPAEERVLEQTVYTWIRSGALRVDVGFLYDPLSAVMAVVVTGVSLLIHIYSTGYMHGHRGFTRYFIYLNLFTFSMLLLVLGADLLVLFVGWEAVGLCSYLLIGYYYERVSAAGAGVKAFLVNRVGDLGFLIGLFLVFTTFGTLHIPSVLESAPIVLIYGGGVTTAIALLLFVGATGKSAQVPLYVWLPDAMEGPTPVSALIHAATMVTAGVYMVARLHVLYLLAPVALGIVALVGAFTAFYAATIALAQNDLKRVLAYSTISQLGYMFLAVGVGAFASGIFHLTTHAYFKALLFMGAGSVMHALHGETDMQRMGGLREVMPVTYRTYLVASLALAGIFPFAGFFSKDAILWETWASGNLGLWAVGVGVVVLTAFYTFRALYLTFHGEPRMERGVAREVRESPRIMTGPLTVLAVLSVLGGLVGLSVIQGGDWLGGFLAPVFEAGRAAADELAGTVAHEAPRSVGLELGLMAGTVALAGVAIGVAHRMYVTRPALAPRMAERFRPVHRLLANKYYVDELYQATVVNPVRGLGRWWWRIWDERIIDGFVNGLAEGLARSAERLRRAQSGELPTYVLTMAIGVVAIVGYYLLIK